VFKNSFKQKEISGFCLTDEEFPIIYINNSTAKARQIFSLFHELCHLLLHTNSITRFDDAYVDDLSQDERVIEQYCNRVTGALLIPADDFANQIRSSTDFGDEPVERLSNRYHISREAVLRRLLDLRLVSSDYYRSKAAQWIQEAEDVPGSSRGNYYATHASYLGLAYMGLVFSNYYQGKISLEETADYLGVRSKSVAGLEALAVGGSR
jgi:Zn-dependent peptidase ImmA (M78 family)